MKDPALRGFLREEAGEAGKKKVSYNPGRNSEQVRAKTLFREQDSVGGIMPKKDSGIV
jgi:hypothetical protein